MEQNELILPKSSHKWDLIFPDKCDSGIVATCIKCGCTKRYIKGTRTYYYQDVVFEKSPTCTVEMPLSMYSEKAQRSLGGIQINEYVRVHNWIRYHYGRAIKCEMCSGLKAKRFDWALRKGFKYEKNVENFIQLCPSCHRKYDGINGVKNVTQASLDKMRLAKEVSIMQSDGKGNTINIFESITKASKATGSTVTSISNCLTGRSKTANGFKWKYNGK
jgi:hypothetical protein